MGSFTSNNDTYACDSDGCQLSCASPQFGPNSCYGMQQNFLDGTRCGGGGKCSNVSCYLRMYLHSQLTLESGSMPGIVNSQGDWQLDRSEQAARDRRRCRRRLIVPHLFDWLHLEVLRPTAPTGPQDGVTNVAAELAADEGCLLGIWRLFQRW